MDIVVCVKQVPDSWAEKALSPALEGILKEALTDVSRTFA